MKRFQGSATICNKEGDLLFYTDGQTIWNHNHAVLKNGTGIFGDDYSTQPALFVPQPGNDSIIYLFTTDTDISKPNRGFCYSVININKGEVIEKNTVLHIPSSQKITAVRGADCSIWVITHPLNSDQYYSYKVTTEGLDLNPIKTTIGLPHGYNQAEGNHELGQLKASPDGKRLACIRDIGSNEGSLEVFDFNTQTGIVSNARQLDVPKLVGYIENLYGVEFSPDNTKLYAANESKLYQYNLLDDKLTAVEVAFNVNTHIWGIQLAPDNKIYCATTSNSNKLYVINQPNVTGVGCDVKEVTFKLNDSQPYYGLPNFIQSYFTSYQFSSDFTFSNVCIGDSVAFSATATDTNVNWQWDFGDPDSGIGNSSSLGQTTHRFTKPGVYKVTLTATNVCGESSTITKQINLLPDPVLNFNGDSIKVCFDETPVKITVPSYPFTTINWSLGETTASIEAYQTGWYKVTASNACKTRSDSIYLQVTPQVTAYLPDDTIVCEGKFALLDAKNTGASYLWNTGETTQTIEVDSPGKYWVEIQNRCSVAVDTANLIFISEDTGIYTTNVFTPNGDGINDTFVNYVINSPNYRMQIVNRWGKIVYETTDPFKHWNGLWKGEQAVTGVYFFWISSQDCRGKPLSIRGTVSLLR